MCVCVCVCVGGGGGGGGRGGGGGGEGERGREGGGEGSKTLVAWAIIKTKCELQLYGHYVGCESDLTIQSVVHLQ